jgi:hypothetical protein
MVIELCPDDVMDVCTRDDLYFIRQMNQLFEGAQAVENATRTRDP